MPDRIPFTRLSAHFLKRLRRAILTRHPPGATRAGLRFGPGFYQGSHVSDDPLWYKDAVFYELHVNAFQDSNGDGIGDFNGLIQRLDYVPISGAERPTSTPLFITPKWSNPAEPLPMLLSYSR